jgi:holo-[acyl-carrier protein] synthase
MVEIARIRGAMENPRFVYRILTDAEREICVSPIRVAGRWAAKEAVYKALGLPLKWSDIEILEGEFGAPRVTIHSNRFEGRRLRIHVSITHERAHAVAVPLAGVLPYNSVVEPVAGGRLVPPFGVI